MIRAVFWSLWAMLDSSINEAHPQPLASIQINDRSTDAFPVHVQAGQQAENKNSQAA
jgi:hypothetical protein